MLATNPVEPRPLSRLEILEPAGPSSPWPRKTEQAPFSVGKFLGVSAVVLAGYVVLGTLGADAAQPAAKAAPGPAAKAGPITVAPAVNPAPGEFRLGPGNNTPPGVVVRLGVQEPFPGDFRLAPGNNQPQGIVPAR